MLKLIKPFQSLLRFQQLMSNFSTSATQQFVLDPFGLRQFNNPSYTGTQVNFDPALFEKKINEYFETGVATLVDGYAPFCKHLFVPNFADVKCGYTEISSENQHLIRSCYEARKENELAVLIQYFDQNEVPPPVATYLDIILYSRDQIIKENLAMGETPPMTSVPWGIISVKGQLSPFELPMQPITMMRNALGVEYGGSGVPLEQDKYQDSVEFWKRHCAIK